MVQPPVAPLLLALPLPELLPVGVEPLLLALPPPSPLKNVDCVPLHAAAAIAHTAPSHINPRACFAFMSTSPPRQGRRCAAKFSRECPRKSGLCVQRCNGRVSRWPSIFGPRLHRPPRFAHVAVRAREVAAAAREPRGLPSHGFSVMSQGRPRASLP